MTKLVEVALPLEAISLASRRDKDKKTGTIRNVHKWFAPMPTPAWRALLFASLVDDPGDEEGRAALLDLVTRLVPPDGNPPDEKTLEEARAVLREATDGAPPTVFDPFCGGGSTLVEALRLGLPAAGSDLNPVPVLITRVLTELIPQVANRPPLVAVDGRFPIGAGPIDGFLADCRHYAEWVRQEVWNQIGHLYPPAPDGGTVVAWLWARTVRCHNPACRATAPLVSSFWLSKKTGAETWIEPVDPRPGVGVRFEVCTGAGVPPSPTKIGRGGNFRCAVCSEPIPESHVKSEGWDGRMGTQLMAVAVDGQKGRSYASPSNVGTPPSVDQPIGNPALEIELPDDQRNFWCKPYGIKVLADVFTNRQLVALGAFADAVATTFVRVKQDGGDETYARAVTSILGLCVGKLAGSSSTQVRWRTRSVESKAEPAFGRHALPMVWDFAETNPFAGSVGDWTVQLESVQIGLRAAVTNVRPSKVWQADARATADSLEFRGLVATDPPYFAQIGYADLSDYFYVWLRQALSAAHPDLFRTIATPKGAELIANPYRHDGDRAAATKFFVDGYTEVFSRLGQVSAKDLPMLIVYAHRQEESDDGGLSSTAWDAMLTALLHSSLRIVGTWPIHATGSSRQIGLGTNALASYVVLVCRRKEPGAQVVDRQRFLSTLRAELPKAIRTLQEGAISSIDLGQATLGPGMAIFSRFAKVIEPNGADMDVSSALKLIGQVQGEVLEEFVGDLDGWTRWAMIWYRDHGFDDGKFGEAENLFKTTNTSLEGLERAGIAVARAGKVRLLAPSDLPSGWDPAPDAQLTVWEVTLHLVRALRDEGEAAAAGLLRKTRRLSDEVRNLSYWLSEAVRHSRPKEALEFDALITSWPELIRLAEREGDEYLQGSMS